MEFVERLIKALSIQSDKNMAFINPDDYMQFIALAQQSLKDVFEPEVDKSALKAGFVGSLRLPNHQIKSIFIRGHIERGNIYIS